jgi:menaquinone-dependent protoporphyrinogen oxidase
VSADRVLVAFSSPSGSTAGIAEVIAAELLRAGLIVECRQARAVADVGPYEAVVLGSGVFVPSRLSDGGGFLARHAAALAGLPVWLYCAGPIGRGRCATGVASAPADCSVMLVAEAVGARGAAVFGPIGLPDDPDPMARLGPIDVVPVRQWAVQIASDLAQGRVVNSPGVSGVPSRRGLVPTT